MVVDWGTLPKDMLELISKSLKSSFDLFQFRCVCSSWRNAAKPSKRLLPSHDIPSHPDVVYTDTALRFCLSQRSILLIKPNYEQAEGLIGGWLVKVEEHSHDLPRKLTILHPLADYAMTHLFPPCSTRVLDMSKFKVRELGREFQLHYEKTVVKYLDDSDEDQSKFVLLTIHKSGRLAVYTSWDQAWTVINDDDMPSCYFCDVILFNGCFFAVTKDGTTVAVDLPSLKLTVLAANPVFGGNKKFLIESSGEMLLVDMYLGMEFDAVSLWNFDEEDVEYHLDDIIANEITRKITVFKFVEREKIWVEVKDLGDKILFLGDESSFSASASDFLPLYGGCVYFHVFVSDWQDLNTTIDDEDFGVCDFASQEMKLVRQHPEYAKLFWPPPSWFTD